MAEPSTPEFHPAEILRSLEGHGVRYILIGALAAAAVGAPLMTRDLDITPALDADNVVRLAAALGDLEARLRTPSDPGGVTFPIDAEMLKTADVWTLVTRAGALDIIFQPSGTRGFDDLRRDAVQREVAANLTVAVASLIDVIRMKEAAGRAKDQAQLPVLRQTLEQIRERERS